MARFHAIVHKTRDYLAVYKKRIRRRDRHRLTTKVGKLLEAKEGLACSLCLFEIVIGMGALLKRRQIAFCWHYLRGI